MPPAIPVRSASEIEWPSKAQRAAGQGQQEKTESSHTPVKYIRACALQALGLLFGIHLDAFADRIARVHHQPLARRRPLKTSILLP